MSAQRPSPLWDFLAKWLVLIQKNEKSAVPVEVCKSRQKEIFILEMKFEGKNQAQRNTISKK